MMSPHRLAPLHRWLVAVFLAACTLLGQPPGGLARNLAGHQAVETSTAASTSDIPAPNSDEPGPWSLFHEAWAIIHDHYLNQDSLDDEQLRSGATVGMVQSQIDLARTPPESSPGPAVDANQQLVYGAIRGMVQSLRDPNSVFLTPRERQVAITSFSGHLQGIGACLETSGDRFVLTGRVDDSPAARGDLQRGDEILAVDGESVAGWQPRDLVLRIRGPAGTSVTLTTRRGPSSEARQVSLIREEIYLISATGQMLEPGIGTLRLNAFTSATDREAGAVLDRLAEEGARALVLDLRGNLGGLLEPAIAVASRFVSADPVVRQQNGRGELYGYARRAEQPLVDWPLTVLVDGWTASASEVLALVLRDERHTQLVGQRTYGKGTIQYLFELSDGSGLHLTAARWVTSRGTQLGDSGLHPDLSVATFKSDQADPALDQGVALMRRELRSTARGPVRPPATPPDRCNPTTPNAA